MNNIIPFTLIDNKNIKSEIEDAIKIVINSGSFVLGEQVSTFESNFSKYCNTKYCAGVANGTDAIELALRAVGIMRGDSVGVPVNSFAATALSVIRIGAIPVFIDCNSDYLVDISSIKDSTIKAVIPVHLYGKMCSISEIRDAVGRDVAIIEDAAQSHGCRLDGTTMGNLSDAAATSFYPTKNLGCYGDGGAVLTNYEHIHSEVKSLRNYGSSIKYYHQKIGFNSRLDEIQAAILNVKLKYLDAQNNDRKNAAKIYDRLLGNLAPERNAYEDNHVYHLYVIEIPKRDECIDYLENHGISAKVHYPVPLHLQDAFSSLGYKNGDFPKAEKISKNIISLPIFPGITIEQQEKVVYYIKKYYEQM